MTREEVRVLYERFGFPVYRRCLAILRDPHLAEDVLQDVFVRVLRYGDGYHGGSMVAWLLRIAHRAALDRLGRDGVRPPARPDEPAPLELPSELLQAPEAARLLSELLHQLPRPLQEVALLTYLDGMNQAEIAAALGCSTMTVKRRVRALHRRAQQLAEPPPEREVGHVEDPA
jgi:RNA polymerase sigma-70 factor (ECF subfamily)